MLCDFLIHQGHGKYYTEEPALNNSHCSIGHKNVVSSDR